MKNIEAKKEQEIKAIVKEEFNYTIPIAEVEKAGISTTGASIKKRIKFPWLKNLKSILLKIICGENLPKSVQYDVKDEFVYRIQIADKEVGEPEIFLSKKQV